MTEAEGPVPPELEVTAEELKHVQANVYDHTVLCLPAAYVRAVPGLAPNVSGGYVQNSDDPRVSDVKTLWVGRAAELAAARRADEAAERAAKESEFAPVTEEEYNEATQIADAMVKKWRLFKKCVAQSLLSSVSTSRKVR